MSEILVGSGASGTAEPAGEKFSELKYRVAEVVGLEDDQEALVTAGHYIIRIIDRLNLRDRYAFLRKVSSTDATITLNARTVSFDADVYIPLALELIDSNSDVAFKLETHAWERMREMYTVEGDAGRPSIWSVRNHYEGREYHWWRKPNQHTVDNYTLRQTFYKRLGRPTGDDDRILAPREITALVELGAQAVFARFKRPNQVALWGSLLKDFKEMLALMSANDERDQPAPQYWGWGPSGNDISDVDFLRAFWNF